MKLLIGMPSLTGSIPIVLVQRILGFKQAPGLEVHFAFTERVLIERARNALAQKALNGKYDYLFFLDDDTLPPTDIIFDMIALDKDIVVAPVADRNGEGTLALFDDDLKPIKQLATTHRVGAGGMSCTLIKRATLEAVAKAHGKPFEFITKEDGGQIGEDVNFCTRAWLRNFETWAIPMKIQHIGRRVAFAYDPATGLTEGAII